MNIETYLSDHGYIDIAGLTFLSKSLASLVRYGGTMSFADTILSIVFLRFSAVNGGCSNEETSFFLKEFFTY
jgi:hypothetical protein